MDPPCLGGEERKEIGLMTSTCLPFSDSYKLVHRMFTPLSSWVCYLPASAGARFLTLWCGISPELEVVWEPVSPGLVSSDLDARDAGLLHGRHASALPSQEAEITNVLEKEAPWHHSCWKPSLNKWSSRGTWGLQIPDRCINWVRHILPRYRFFRKKRLNLGSLTLETWKYILNSYCGLPTKLAYTQGL